MSTNHPDSSQTVRVHSQQSTRKSVSTTNARREKKNDKAKGKEKEKGESRTVFKPVLSNPFEIQWPIVPLEVQQAIFDRSLHFLSDFGAVQRLAKKQRTTFKNYSALHPESSTDVALPEMPHITSADYPYHSAVVAGINAVSKILEGYVQSLYSCARQPEEIDGARDEYSDDVRPWFVLICRQDVFPPLLVQHVLHLVASLNTNRGPRRVDQFCKLVPLPKGSEAKLAEVMGVRRAAVVLIRAKSFLNASVEKDEVLASLIASVPAVISPYLVGTPAFSPFLQRPNANAMTNKNRPEQVAISKTLITTHVKHLKTTAPMDMRSVKLARSKARAAARAKRKERGIKEKAKTKASTEKNEMMIADYVFEA